jgi:hypothetical protein
MTSIKAGPIPLHNPETPSFLIISRAASNPDGLIFLIDLEEFEEVVTARVDWAVWTVQIGFVTRVVMEPENSNQLDWSVEVYADDEGLTCNKSREDTLCSA